MVRRACDSEHLAQCKLVSWFRKSFPGELIFAIPNGGARSNATAANLKAEGVVSGVPDLFIPGMRMFLEMKREFGGSTSKAQTDMHEKLREAGYTVTVCKGFEAAKEAIMAEKESGE